MFWGSWDVLSATAIATISVLVTAGVVYYRAQVWPRQGRRTAARQSCRIRSRIFLYSREERDVIHSRTAGGVHVLSSATEPDEAVAGPSMPPVVDQVRA